MSPMSPGSVFGPLPPNPNPKRIFKPLPKLPYSREISQSISKYSSARREFERISGEAAELGSKLSELNAELDENTNERKRLEGIIEKSESKANSFFTRSATKKKLNEEIDRNKLLLNNMDITIADLTTESTDIGEAYKKKQEELSESEKNLKDMIKELVKTGGLPEQLKNELQADSQKAENEFKRLQGEQKRIDDKISAVMAEMPGFFSGLLDKDAKDRKKSLQTYLSELKKDKAKINRQMKGVSYQKNAVKGLKEAQERDMKQKETDDKIANLYKEWQTAKLKVENEGGDDKASQKTIKEAADKEKAYLDALKRDKGFLERVDLGEFDKEVFADAKRRAEEEKRKRAEELQALKSIDSVQGTKYFKESPEYKKAVEDCIKMCNTIIAVMTDLKKDFPNGFPYPEQVVSVSRKSKKKARGLRRLFGSPKEVKTFKMSYGDIKRFLEVIFGDEGYIQQLKESIFTDKRPNHYGFKNVAEKSQAAYKVVKYDQITDLFERVQKAVAEEEGGDVKGAEKSQEEKEKSKKISDAFEELLKAIDSSMDKVHVVVGDQAKTTKDEALQKVDEKIVADDKLVQERLKVLKDKFSSDDSLDGKMKKLGEGIGLATTVLNCIKLPGIKDVSGTISRSINAPFTIAKKLINIFGIKRVYGPAFRGIQQQLEDAYDDLNKSYNKAINLYDSYVQELLKKKNKEENAAFAGKTDKSRKNADIDWTNIRKSLMKFSQECIDIAKPYKAYGLHVHQHTKLLQKAKQMIINFMLGGVFNTEANVSGLAEKTQRLVSMIKI